MRSGNPVLAENVFQPVPGAAVSDQMTISGTVNKTLLSLLLCLVGASWTWNIFFSSGNPQSVMPWVITGAIAGFVVALVIIFRRTWAPMLTPVYAVLEGFVLGGLSAIFEAQLPGIVIQAVGLTFGTLFVLLLVYKSGMIRVTDNFRLGVVAATGAIAVVYLIDIVLGFFNIRIPMIHQTGWLGIGFSLFVVTIASLNLVLDFDFIERGAASGAPKYMEWYGAFGLMVTLVWLYLEILRLLSKIRGRS